MNRRLLVVCLAFVLAGCGGDGNGSQQENLICEPGETQPCYCISGLYGVQECLEDGSGWSECECPDEDGGTDSDADADADGDSDTDTNPDCWNGPCCNTETSQFLPSDYECDSWTSYACSSDDCGGAAQQVTEVQHCTGASNQCNGEIVAGAVTTIDECDTASELCETDGTSFAQCASCEHGCADGACYADCNPEEICCGADGEFLGSSTVCDSVTEFRCSAEACGADPETRTVTTYCSGDSGACDGLTTEGFWLPMVDCSDSELCETDTTTYAQCLPCHHLCSEGACTDTCLDFLQWDGDYTVSELADLEEIDGYTDIVGNLVIDGTELVDLDLLHCLKHVQGDLIIENNSALTDMTGLSSLESVGDETFIRYNGLIENLSGLSSFASATDGLYIMGNPSLETLDGLESLGYVGYYFNISSNATLISLTALANLQEVEGTLYLWGNNSLTALYGLEGIEIIAGELLVSSNANLANLAGLVTHPCNGCSLYITNNPALPTCEATALRDQFIADGWYGSSYLTGNDDLATCD